MELRLRDSTNPGLTSSGAYSLAHALFPIPLLYPPMRRRPRRWIFFAAKSRGGAALEGLQRETKRALSHILRTEAAVLGVERKTGSAKNIRLWPRAVLEALEDAIASNRWESALKIFGLLRKQQWYVPRCQIYAKLLMMLGRCKQPESAGTLFKIMMSEGLKPTLDVYTALVGAFGQSGMLDEAFGTFNEMKTTADCIPDVYTYTILIKCCCKLHCFDEIPALLDEMSYLGIECNIVTYNTVIDGYGKAGMFEAMENCVSEILESGICLPDIYTMNSIISAYGNRGKMDEMESWYGEFQLMGIDPDVKTFNILVKSYGMAGMYKKMDAVMEFMRKRFFPLTTVTYNIVIDSFGRAGNIEKMEHFFRTMKHRGCKPNSITYCSVVNGYSKAGLLDEIPAIIRQIENADVALDTPFFNCVINAYGQTGDFGIMEEMFLLMKEKKCRPDGITFATMIQSYNKKGMVQAAKELELKMHKMGSTILEAG